MKIMNNYSIILLFIASVIALSVAYVSQYLFLMLPCKLCIYERVPYFITIGLFLIHLLKPSKVIFFCMCLCYVCNVLISGYHVALEHSWVSDIFGCTDSIESGTFDDIKNALLNKSITVSCNHPSFLFMGLSMAACNFIYCLLCLVLSIHLFFKQYVKDK
ncbi:disulfide bond formation protein B [Ehrlichia ruminantium]|uniref:Disulfide bond formation protein B n=1 Tax=Ehrlichia ruminantium TaxID=779 RepID=A0AAE6Q9X4_EHRRU|nr:disulfide bond formation protein B [Ehrlichia ruminantium]QGR02305.1 disulfide bond formation protein B [Ehrlichia ruminantium]QGR03225.1 disulfide bond formation protein B [Ehrlichia ruminantium]QGR04150.1 disulfide bond formation protein B [Ehrlichia ruminantium]